MYIPKHFEITDDAEIDRFLEGNTFGQLISMQDEAPVSSHLPFMFVRKERKILGHLAKANPQWQSLEGQKVLITLQGDHAYVSPSWYASAGVPTWNYQAVHIAGTATSFTDTQRLKQLVDTLTAENEKAYAEPWQPNYPATMLRGIVGIEVAITSIQCKYKLSQNKSAVDQKNVSKHLAEAGHATLSRAMSKN